MSNVRIYSMGDALSIAWRSHHAGEYVRYGSPTNAPGAYMHSGGVETPGALAIEQKIQSELSQSGFAKALTPAEEQHLFDVSANCVTNPATCPKLEPKIDPGASTTPR